MHRLLTCLFFAIVTHQAFARASSNGNHFQPYNGIVVKTSSAQQKLMDGTPYEVELTPNGIKLDGEYTLIRGGSIQWFRLPEGSWEDRIAKFKNMGFNTIDMYIAWNQIEPQQGVFNFDQPNLRKFLELAATYGIHVSVRPGPYITNEMDGGGLPAWLTRNSTKKNYDLDGKVNLRTHDPDFIHAVKNYFSALNEILSEYTADKGGPIILYTIENEFNWFERAFNTDKIFWYEGQFERPLNAKLDINTYFSALRDIVRETGITTPIISCPGDGKISSLGDVEDVIPMPNIYEWANPGQPEQIAFDLLSQMKNPEKHGGIYTQYPSGSLELSRSAQEMRRLVVGGLDAFFVFNLAGILQTGYLNGMTMAARIADEKPHWGAPGEKGANWLATIFDFSDPKRIFTGFVAPEQGYFGNIIDYMGAISSSGVLRELFYLFRRDNMFFNSFENIIGAAGKPHRVAQDTQVETNPTLSILNKEIGVRQKNGTFHYWLENDGGTSFLSLVNQSGQKQKIDIHGIHYKGKAIPQYQAFHVPNSAEPKKTYSHMLGFNIPLTDGLDIAYTTSEILTVRPFNDEILVVLYGDKGDFGEISFNGTIQLNDQDQQSFQIHPQNDQTTILTYPHTLGTTSSLTTMTGQKIRLLITDREQAGRVWFLNHKNHDILLSGADYVDEVSSKNNRLSFRYSYDWRQRQLMILSPLEVKLADHEIIKSSTTDISLSFYERASEINLPGLPKLTKESFVSFIEPASLNWDQQSEGTAELEWLGQPKPLEQLGIYQGHAWYTTKFHIDNIDEYKGKGRLYIQGASDFIGIYINDHYLGTLAPVGTEIDNFSHNPNYKFPSLRPYLKNGENTLKFRTEIWGRGSFMFGRGQILGTKARIPSIAYDGSKGLFGKAYIDKIPLSHWKVLKGIEVDHFTSNNATIHEGLPPFERGGSFWQSFAFDTSELPSERELDAPIVLELNGRRSKATILLNGVVIGRWLSDKHWLTQGSWLRPQRNMWSTLSADHFPIPRSLLKRAGEGLNELRILFEDTSSLKDPVGFVDRVELKYNREGLLWQPGRSHEGNIETTYMGTDGLGVRAFKYSEIEF